MSVARLERMTTGSADSALSYRATQVDSMLTDSDKIANEFNNYFVNIGRLLSEQITSPHTSEEYLGDRPNVSFKFSPVSEDRIGNIIKHLKSKSSYGYDEISNNLIKHASNSLIKPLTLIVN